MMDDADKEDEQIRMEARNYNVPDAVPRDRMWARIQAARAADVGRVRPASTRVTRAEWRWLGVGIAAVLLLGIGLGRISMRRPAHTPTAISPAPSPGVVVAARQSDTERLRSTSLPSASPDSGRGRTRAIRVGQSTSGGAGSPMLTLPGGTEADRAATTSLLYRMAVAQHLAGTDAMLTSFRAAARSGEVDAQITRWARDLLGTTRLLQSSPAADDPTTRRLLDDLELVLVQIAQYTARAPHRAEELDLIQQSIDRRGVIDKLRTTIPAGITSAGT